MPDVGGANLLYSLPKSRSSIWEISGPPGRNEIDPDEIDPDEIDPDEIDPDEIDPDEIDRLALVSPGESIADQTSDLPMRALGRLTGAVHHGLIFGRRVRALADHIAEMIPTSARTVLDVGCGDGTLASLVMKRRPDVSVVGIEVRARPVTAIPVIEFDGRSIPFAAASHDIVMMVDVLHHAEDAQILLQEAARVSAQAVIIKDHLLGRLLSRQRLRAMDWVGNIGHGVALPYNYWTREQWRTGFERAGLLEVDRREELGLYAPPASWIFEPGLHFVSRLRPVGAGMSPQVAE